MEVCDADSNDGISRGFVFRLLCPDTIHAPIQSSDPRVIAHKDALCVKRLVGPRVVLKSSATIRRPRECHNLLAIFRIAATIIEEDVRGTVCGIHSQPLKEVIGAVMQRIIVYADCRTPGFAVIRGGRAKYVDTPVAVIAPRHKQTTALRTASRIDADFGKSIRTRNGLNREHRRGSIDDVSRTRKGEAAVVGAGENDVTPVGPYRVKSAIWRDGTG